MSSGSGEAGRPTVLRSGGSFALGIVAAGLLLLIAVLTGWSRPSALGLALLGAAGCHALLVHPQVRIDEHGVLLVNPLRWARVPWALLDEVVARLSLEIFTEDEKLTSWAVGATRQRATPGPALLPSRSPESAAASVSRFPVPESTMKRPGPMTAQRAKVLIERAHEQWRERVDAGALTPAPDPVVTRGWVWRTIVPLVAGVAVTTYGLVT